jgi:PAS domain S-box-containing protein
MLENELFGFLEGTTDAAFSVNEAGEILSWNSAAERLFGYSSSEVLGKGCYQMLSMRLHKKPLRQPPPCHHFLKRNCRF